MSTVNFRIPPSAIVALFFTLMSINVMPSLVPLGTIAGVAFCFCMYYRELYYFLTKNRFVAAYPLIVLGSATWSTVPFLSLWYGVQLSVCIIAAIFMGIIATPRQIIRGIFIAMAIIIVSSIISGRKGPSAEGAVLVGVTGGKTAIGFVAVALVTAAIAILFDRQQPRLYRLASLPFMALGVYIATHVHAATALVSVAVFPFVFLGLLTLRYFAPVARWTLVVLLLVLAVPIAGLAIANSQEISDSVLKSLNKDSTLTGRTLIWAKADEWIARSPIVGHGYRAFWASGSSDSVGILHFFGLTDFRSFAIHNLMREILVDTGWLGFGAFLATTAIFLYYVISFVFLYPSPASAFVAATFLLQLSRVPIDSLIGIFYPPTLFFYVSAVAAIVFHMNERLSRYAIGRTNNANFDLSPESSTVVG